LEQQCGRLYAVPCVRTDVSWADASPAQELDAMLTVAASARIVACLAR
jgi:hypothetical protein